MVPFVMRVSNIGSHDIGTGSLKWASFLNPNWYMLHGFIVMSDSKWYEISFFTRMFAMIIMKKATIDKM